MSNWIDSKKTTFSTTSLSMVLFPKSMRASASEKLEALLSCSHLDFSRDLVKDADWPPNILPKFSRRTKFSDNS